ncbi:MAG TPA: DUF5916 domain-containing protein, partial [Bacteroidota bacterium]
TGGSRSNAGGWYWYIGTGLEVKPTSRFRVRIGPEFVRDHTIAQWLTVVVDPYATSTFGARHVFATLDQKTLSANIRLDWTFTPRLSLQVYLQPLISSGSYGGFNELTRPQTFMFTTYGENGSTIGASGGTYTADPDGVGPAPPFSFSDPDFNFKSLRGNAVLRWEYSPGSVLYFVWTQDRTDSDDPGTFRFGRDFRNLLSANPNNIFLIKLSYWWNL